MDRQQIRPSLAEYDELAFPELHPTEVPAATVTRSRPPTIVSSSSTAPDQPATAIPRASADGPPKAKSRFALQREREAAERAAASRGAERFTLDLDDDGPEALPVMPQLVGEVVERESGDAAPPLPPTTPGPAAPSPLAGRRTGFPTATRLPPKMTEAAATLVPLAVPLEEPSTLEGTRDSLPALLSSVSAANEDVLRGMSEEEILEEQRSIRESLGLSAGVLRMLEERGKKHADTGKKAAPAARSVRPVPEAGRRAGRAALQEQEDEEEGSPEYIRRHFFPDEPRNANLDWMTSPPPPSVADSPDAHASPWTFDLDGTLLPLQSHLPAHSSSSSHHVSSATTFTIPSLLALTSSSVPSQRSTSFLVLSRIIAISSHAITLGQASWDKLRIDSVYMAGLALRDSNRGVVSNALSLLALLFSTEQLHTPVPVPTALEGAEVPPTLSAAFLSADPYSSLALNLSLQTLPRLSALHILQILASLLRLSSHGVAKSLAVEELVAAPSLLERLSTRLVALPWPPLSAEMTPSVLALLFFADLARSSRDHARALWERGLVEPGMRFLVILPWEFDDAETRTLGYELLGATLDYWEAMGRYGLATGLRTSAAALLDPLARRFSSLFGPEATAVVPEEDLRLAGKWLALLRVWTTAAVDPHVTGHDILWTQVRDWEESAVEVHRWALRRHASAGHSQGQKVVLSRAWELLAAWLEGSKVNQSWRGEDQRKWVLEKVGMDFQAGGSGDAVVREAMAALVEKGDTPPTDDVDIEASLVLSAVGLSDAYEETSTPITSALLVLDSSRVDSLFSTLLRRHERSWPATRLLIALLPRPSSPDLRLAATLDIIPALQAGDEVAARDLTSWVLATVAAPADELIPSLVTLSPSLELPALAKVAMLRPFITYAIVTASGGRVVAPLLPTPRDLKLTACQHPFASSTRLLGPNWPLVVLDELLRSGTSPVLEQLPAGWDGSELELVRSSLSLMRVAQSAGSERSRLAGPVLVYNLIKVFMLEKDNTTSATPGAETDLFRDDVVQASMTALFAPLTVARQPVQRCQPDFRTAAQTIESVSSLVSSAPFYRLYTDLVGLYDSISLSHPVFAQILLPPLAMAYPSDYRKLLWIDYSHLLRTIKTAVGDALTDAPGEGALASFLYPVETEANLLGAYGDALVSAKVSHEENGFLYLVALHHVASTIFSADGPTPIAIKLARSVVAQGSKQLVERVLGYGQDDREGCELVGSPMCWDRSGEALAARKEKLAQMLDEAGTQKLEAML